MERLSWLDLAKGLGILSVVAYHTVEGIKNSFTDPGFLTTSFADYFSSWLMPMFFIVSGMLSKNAIDSSSKQKVNRKIKDWIYIYVLWSFIIYLFRLLSNPFTNTSMELTEILYIAWDPVPTIWFLYALILSFFISYVLRGVSLYIVLSIALASNLLNEYYSGWFPDSIFERIAWIYVFYAVGFYFKDQIIDLCQNKIFYKMAFPSFILLSGAQLYFYFLVPVFIKPVYSIFMSMLFVGSCFLVFRVMGASKIYKFFVFVGSISLFVYLTHFPFPAATRIFLLKLDIYDPVLLVFLATAIALFAALVAHRASRFKAFEYLFSRPKLNIKS